MAAELVAERGHDASGEGVGLAGREPLVQRGGDHGGGDSPLDRLLHGPPSLAGVLHVALDGGELLLVGEGQLGQVEQPGAHHRPVAPHVGHLVQVEAELGGAVEQGEALGVGLEHAVLDAVVDHLHEMPGADGADVGIAVLGGQGQEDGLEALDGLALAADHQAVAVLQAPDAAGHAGVDEGDALGGQAVGVGLGQAVVGVPPFHDDVAGFQPRLQGHHGVLGRGAGREHEPDRPRRGEVGDHLVQAGGADGPLRLDAFHRFLVAVEGDHLVAVAEEPQRHVGPHAAQSDHRDPHPSSFRSSTSVRSTRRPWDSRLSRSPSAWAPMSVPKS